MSEKPMLYAMVTAKWGYDVGGTLFDHEGEPIHGHMSSSEWWLWRDLTIGFSDRAALLDARYPDGYDVTCLGASATDEEMAPLHALWDKNHPGWRSDVKEEEK